MALSLHFPRLETEFPSEIALLRVKHRPWTREAAGELAHRLEVRADADDAGLWLIARDERSVLEVYQASQSFRYRSEEHTSELQSQSNLVCRLLLEKKKKDNQR